MANAKEEGKGGQVKIRGRLADKSESKGVGFK